MNEFKKTPGWLLGCLVFILYSIVAEFLRVFKQ